MVLYELNRNDLCLCGSGKKYKQCCLKFIELTYDDYYAEIDKCNYELAYNAINSELTKYLINVKRHTDFMLKENNAMALPLLKIDIEAIGEFFNNILFLVSKKGIDIDFITKINFISSLLDKKSWRERINSFILIYYFIIKRDDIRLNNEMEQIKIDEIEDIELIKLVLDIKSDNLGMGQELALIEKIIVSEKDVVIKAKYQFQKALVYILNNDNDTGLKIAKEAIEILDNSIIKEDYHLHVSAHIFSMYAQITSDNMYYHKAISLNMQIIKDDNLTDVGKAKNLIALGHTYYLLGDYESAVKYLDDSKKIKYFHLADIYTAFVKIGKAEYESAIKILSQIVYDELEEEKFDYLTAYSLCILNTKDVTNIDMINGYLNDISFDNHRYFDTIKMELLLELQKMSFNDAIKDEKVRLKWLDILNKSIMLQPNFFGLGINLNNFIDMINRKSTKSKKEGKRK